MKLVGPVLAIGILAAAAWWVFVDSGETPAERGTAAPAAGPGAGAAEPAIPEPVADIPAPVVADRFPGEREPPDSPAPVPREGLTIETVDASGALVADFPLVLRTLRGEKWRQIWDGATGADGTCVVHGGLQGRSSRSPDAAELACGFPEITPTTMSLDPARLPGGPVRFVVPPTGHVVVDLLDGSRRPVRKKTSIAFRLQPSGLEVPPDQSAVRVDAVEGRAELRWIGLGGEVLLSGTCEGRPDVEGRVNGPRSPGETVRTELAFRDPFPVIVGRAVDAARDAIAAASLRVRVESRTDKFSSSTSGSLKTDAGGRFRWILSTELEDGGTRTFALTRKEKAGAEATVEIDLSRVLPPGETDLGDVVLALGAGPLGASGRVLDADGKPVPGAEVTYALISEVDQRFFIGERIKAGDEGRFTIELNGRATGLRLSATCPGHLPSAQQEVRTGATGIEIVLGREGIVTGSLLLGADVPRGRVRIRLRREGADPGGHGEFDRFPDKNGTFEFKELEPGVHEFSVRIVGEIEPCVVVPGIVVAGGRNPEDPRLRRIDLRTRIRTITVRVLRPDGKPAADGRLIVLPAGRRDHVEGFRLQGEPVRIATSAPSLDLVATAEGYRLATAAAVTADHTLRFAPALSVRCVLATDVVLPDPPRRLKIQLVPLRSQDGEAENWSLKIYAGDGITSSSSGSGGGAPPIWNLEPGEVGASREAIIAVAEPGRYQLKAWLEDGDTSTTVPAVPETIDVPDSPVPFETSVRCLARD